MIHASRQLAGGPVLSFGALGASLHCHNLNLERGHYGRSQAVIPDPRGFGLVTAGISHRPGQPVSQLVTLSFDNSGILRDELLMVPQGGNVASVKALAAYIDGRVIVAGSNVDGSSFLTRQDLTSKGVDPQFGANFDEWVRRVRRRSGQVVEVGTVHVERSGKLLVAGSVYVEGGTRIRSKFLVRLNHDGTPDDAFRKYGGPSVHPTELNFRFTALGHFGDGRLLAVGDAISAAGLSTGIFVVFLDNGEPIIDSGPDYFRACTLTTCCAPDRSGGMILGGFVHPPETSQRQARIRRLNADGTIDYNFGWGDRWIVPRGDTEITALQIRSNGQIVTTGRCGTSPAIFCFEPDGTPSQEFGDAGVLVIEDFGGLGTGLCLRDPDEVVVNVDTIGDGFLLLSFRLPGLSLVPPAPTIVQSPSTPPPIAEPATTQTPNPYAGRSEQSLMAEATQTHLAHTQASTASMTSWAKRMSAGSF